MAEGSGRRAWGEILDAWRAEFPGRFDQFDDYELATAIGAEVPEFEAMADPLSREALLAPGRAAAPVAPAPVGPRVGPRSESAPAGKEAPIDMGVRAPTWGDTITEVGLAAVPAVAGGLLGTPAGPAGAAAGAAIGGSLGELMREAYQGWAGLREDGISWTNVAAQGAINALPIGGAAARVGRAVAPTLAEVTPAIVGRVGRSVAEGAVGGTTSTALERVIRDQEVPGLGELAASAGIGAVFGGGVGVGAEAWRAGRAALANRRVPTDDIGGLLDQLVSAPPEAKSAVAQQIYERAEQLRAAGDPAGGQAILQQLMAAGAQVEQASLQGIAADFLRTYSTQVDALTVPQRRELTQAFLSELRARNLNAQAYGQLAESLRALEAGTPPPLFGPVEGPATREAQPIPGAENFGLSTLEDFAPLEAQMAAGLEAPQDLRPRLRTSPDAPPLVPEEYALQAGFREAEAQAAAHPYYGRQAAIPLEGTTPLTPSGTAMRAAAAAEGSGAPPDLVGVDAHPAVAAGRVGREDALFMEWMMEDLREFPFQPGTAEGWTNTDISWREQQAMGGGNVRFVPHVAGSQVQHLFDHLLGIPGSKRELATRMENFLTGKARNPAKSAQAAVVVARAIREAYITPEVQAQRVAQAAREGLPEPRGRFDVNRISDATWATLRALRNPGKASVPFTRASFAKFLPVLSPRVDDGMGRMLQPEDLVDRFGLRPAAPDAPTAAPRLEGEDLTVGGDLEPPTPTLREVDALVRSLDDGDLLMLYKELEEARLPNAGEIMEGGEGEGFGGPWYEVGPGVLAREIERRGLGEYQQPSLVTEGPGTPGRMPLLEGLDETLPPVLDAETLHPTPTREAYDALARTVGVSFDAGQGGHIPVVQIGGRYYNGSGRGTATDPTIVTANTMLTEAEFRARYPSGIPPAERLYGRHGTPVRTPVGKLYFGDPVKFRPPDGYVPDRYTVEGEGVGESGSRAPRLEEVGEGERARAGAGGEGDLVTLYRVEAPRGRGVPAWVQQGLEESGAAAAQGRWWTDDPRTLEFYRQDAGEGHRVRTVRLPRAEAEQYRVRQQPPEVQRFSRDWDTEFFLPSGRAEQAEVDLLPTGETQPRLPGDVGAVRDLEVATPTLLSEADLFSLTSEVAPAPKPRLRRLFEDETGAVGKLDATTGTAPAARRSAEGASPLDFTLAREGFSELEGLVRAAGGQEVSGLLLGDAQGQIHRIIPTANTAPDPTRQFAIAPQVIARAQQLAAREGWSLLGSFHSQPTGSAEPSKADLQGTVRDLPMLILGDQDGRLVDMRVWRPTLGPRGGKSAPWLEGTFQVRDALDTPGFPAGGAEGAALARDLVDTIPRYRGAPGDGQALKGYLETHAAAWDGLPWYGRAQQYLAEGNPRMAWVETQAGQLATAEAARRGVRAGAAAGDFAKEVADAMEQQITRAIAGGPQDPIGALFALYDGRTTWVDGVGTVVVAPEIPAGLRGKGIQAGPGGLLDPGRPGVRLPDESAIALMTVEEVNKALSEVKASHILDDPTQASATRLNRQITERLLLNPASTKATKAWEAQLRAQGMNANEAKRTVQQARAAHFRQSASTAGKILAALSVYKRKHAADIRKIEGIRGASGEINDLLIYGAGGRQLGRLGDLAEADVVKDLILPGRAWDQTMLLSDLTRQEVGRFAAFESASRGFMLSQFATAARNFHSATGRWGTELFTGVAQAIAHTAVGRPGRALNQIKRVADLARLSPVLRPDGWVMPWHARQAEWELVLSGLLNQKGDRGAALRLLGSLDGEMAHFLGSANFGDPNPNFQSRYRFLNWIASPQVQNTLTMFNRAQEFTVRSAYFTTELKHQIRERGLDPTAVLAMPPADVAAAVGGEEQLRRLLHRSAAASLDFTFAGALVRKGLGKDFKGRNVPALNTAVIDLINRVPFVRAGYPFPKFNFSAAPRFLWDYGPGGALEAVNYGLLAATGGKVGVGRGRLYLGKKALKYERELIPELDRKLWDAEADYGGALEKVHALTRERGVLRRLVKRAEGRVSPGQQALGESAVLSYRRRLEQVEQALERESEGAEAFKGRVKDLQAQRKSLVEVVDEATHVAAPQSAAEVLGKSFGGTVGLLGLAMLLRADQVDKGTKWYQLRFGASEENPEGWMLDTRPLAPFTQVLFLADVLIDLHNNTDLDGMWTDVENGIPWDDAFMGRYEGKYTSRSLGQETLNAFLSISQAAGTTLALIEQFTDVGQKGFSPRDFAETFLKTVGGFLARFTIPLAQTKALTDLWDSEESVARITDTSQGWAAPLLQPVANLPFLGQVIPDTYNQLSGKPLDTWMPQLRALGGVSLQQWERVAGEVAEVGLPGQTTYLRATHDYELDRALAFHYAYGISTFGEQLIWGNEYYQSLDTPATKRDYLQQYVFPAFKQYAIGQMMAQYGPEAVLAAREGAEARRRRLRMQRLAQLALEEGIDFTEGAEGVAGAEGAEGSTESELSAPEPPPEDGGAAPTFESVAPPF